MPYLIFALQSMIHRQIMMANGTELLRSAEDLTGSSVKACDLANQFIPGSESC